MVIAYMINGSPSYRLLPATGYWLFISPIQGLEVQGSQYSKSDINLCLYEESKRPPVCHFDCKSIHDKDQKTMERTERRKHIRFPVIKRLSEPVDIFLSDPKTGSGDPVPGVIVDISAGGMGLITFAPIDENTTLSLNIDLPAIGKTELDAKVAWTMHKRGVYQMGMEFVNPPEEITKKLEDMGESFEKCHLTMADGKTDICRKDCACYVICDNPFKKV